MLGNSTLNYRQIKKNYWQKLNSQAWTMEIQLGLLPVFQIIIQISKFFNDLKSPASPFPCARHLTNHIRQIIYSLLLSRINGFD